MRNDATTWRILRWFSIICYQASLGYSLPRFQVPIFVRQIMSKKYFIKFVSEPKNDTIKSIVGIACTAQAIADGHDVSVSSAAGTRLSTHHPGTKYWWAQIQKIVWNDGKITDKPTLYCSFASVKATLGHSRRWRCADCFRWQYHMEWSTWYHQTCSASEIQLVY